MNIVVANNKGGQGKTLLAVLLIQHMTQKGENVTACDMDRTQLNLTDFLRGTDIKIFASFNDIPNSSLCIIDTPPLLNDILMDAIRHADQLVVPITLGKHAVQGVCRIAELRDKRNTKFIINSYDGSSIQRQAMEFLTAHEFEFAGVIPRYRRLAYNIDCGLPWATGFSPAQARHIRKILDGIIV